MKANNIKILERYFSFLFSGATIFKLVEVKSYDYALYAKFLSDIVGIYFIFEFRDKIPQLQFTKLETNKLEIRPGLYTINELYKNDKFKLQSFYLNEIMLFKKAGEYKSDFKDLQKIEDAIAIIANLTRKYAMDFVIGNEDSYNEINTWYKIQVQNPQNNE